MTRVSERTIGVAVGPGELAAGDVVLDLGPRHPSAHGGLRLVLGVDGDVITRAEPVVGFMHRGAEKLFEVRDYRQILVLANRHDWLSAFAGELGVVLVVERMLGLEVPQRAVWARTLLAEITRAFHHVVFLGAVPPQLAGAAPALTAEREALQDVLEEATGGRIHPMLNRVGGLKDDLPLGWLDRVEAATAAVRARLDDVGSVVHEDETFAARTRGVGKLPAADVQAYGVSGPVARASGVALDLRRDDPYLAYAELDVRVVTRHEGDCHARYACLLDDLAESLRLADACAARLRGLPPGPVGVRLPKIVKAPEGHAYAWTENPAGINGYYLVSRGEKTPWRLKLRTASYGNVQVLASVLPGHRVADLVAVLGSLFYVVGDIDR